MRAQFGASFRRLRRKRAAELFAHPAFEEGLGGLTNRGLIELPPEPFDVEQRLLA